MIGRKLACFGDRGGKAKSGGEIFMLRLIAQSRHFFRNALRVIGNIKCAGDESMSIEHSQEISPIWFNLN